MTGSRPSAAWPLNRWIVATAAISGAVAALVALVIVLVASPIYRAETNVSIRPRIADLGAAEAAGRLIRNYAVWVDSEAYVSRIAEDARRGLAIPQVLENVRVGGDADRLLVTIQSEDTDAARAAATVNGLAALLVDEVATPARTDDPEKGLEVAIIDPAAAPTSAVWPRPEVVLPLAAAIGAALGATYAWLAGLGTARQRAGEAAPHG